MTMDKVIVVTGASSGIGAAFAKLAGARGAKLVLAARRETELRQIAAGCGGLAVVADVTRRSDVQRIVDAALQQYSRIDVWINNAGRGITRPALELTDEDIDEMMLVNFKSALYGAQAVVPHMRAQKSGHIINVSSMLGRIPSAMFRSAYCGAKHFLNALTATFRAEVQQTHPGIQFSLVSPGVVRTEFGLNARHGGPDSRQLPDSQSAEEVAEVIVGVIASRQPDVYTKAGAHDRVVNYFDTLAVDP